MRSFAKPRLPLPVCAYVPFKQAWSLQPWRRRRWREHRTRDADDDPAVLAGAYA